MLMIAFLGLAGAVVAQAASKTKMGELTKVKVFLRNVTDQEGTYTVILQARNQGGARVATLAKAVALKTGGSQKVEFEWHAPPYATELKWKTLVVKGVAGELALTPLEADGKNDEVKEKDKEEDRTGGDDF